MPNLLYTNPKFIIVLEHMLTKGRIGSCVIGTENYAAINGDDTLRETYNNLIEQGLKIGFNPTTPTDIDTSVSGSDIGIINREKGAGLVLHNSETEAQQRGDEIDAWYQHAVHLTNFNLPVEDLEQVYEATKASS